MVRDDTAGEKPADRAARGHANFPAALYAAGQLVVHGLTFSLLRDDRAAD